MKAKSPVVLNLDYVQGELLKLLKPIGFSRKGRAFRRESDHEVFQIVGLHAGPFEVGPPLPPGFTPFPGIHYGKFRVSLGVYVPEIYERVSPPLRPGRVISDMHCQIRTELGRSPECWHRWWPLHDRIEDTVEEVKSMLIQSGIPFLERFGSREKIIADWVNFNETEFEITRVPRLDVAMILLQRNKKDEASQLIVEHLNKCKVKEELPHVQRHMEYVRELAAELGLEPLS